MITIHQLKNNLKQSYTWTETFKKDIKAFMEEITLNIQQITHLTKHNADLRTFIDHKRRDLKSQIDEKIKLQYKTDKLQITLEEMQTRLQLYEEIHEKKEEWNRELTNKLALLEVDVERERHSLDLADEQDNYFLDKASESSVSGSSYSSSFFKENSIKKVFGNPRAQIDERLRKVKALQDAYLKQGQKCRRLEEELQKANKKYQRLRNHLTQLQISDPQQEKQNNYRGTMESFDFNIPKEARIMTKTLRQLEQKSKNLNGQITAMYKKIEDYSAALNGLLKADSEVADFHREVFMLEREVRKEKNTIQSIKPYILTESN